MGLWNSCISLILFWICSLVWGFHQRLRLQMKLPWEVGSFIMSDGAPDHGTFRRDKIPWLRLRQRGQPDPILNSCHGWMWGLGVRLRFPNPDTDLLHSEKNHVLDPTLCSIPFSPRKTQICVKLCPMKDPMAQQKTPPFITGLKKDWRSGKLNKNPIFCFPLLLVGRKEGLRPSKGLV